MYTLKVCALFLNLYVFEVQQMKLNFFHKRSTTIVQLLSSKGFIILMLFGMQEKYRRVQQLEKHVETCLILAIRTGPCGWDTWQHIFTNIILVIISRICPIRVEHQNILLMSTTSSSKALAAYVSGASQKSKHI